MSEREQIITALGEGVVETFDPELKRVFDFADQTVSKELRNVEKLKFHEGQLKLSGDAVFYTLQGEGPSMGKPAVFVRTHICNLRCAWCDAWYTWNPKTEEFWTEPQDVPVAKVAQSVRDLWLPKNPEVSKRVVVTGGEPVIQQNEIVNLIGELGSKWQLEIETNGTIMPNNELLQRAQFNCSPKLRNSMNSRRASIRPNVLQALNGVNTTFKFVVMKPEDLDEIQTDFIDGVGLDYKKVILMPQGVTAEEVRMNMQNVAEYAKRKGFRLLGRLQNDIWGARRGV